MKQEYPKWKIMHTMTWQNQKWVMRIRLCYLECSPEYSSLIEWMTEQKEGRKTKCEMCVSPASEEAKENRGLLSY